MNSRGQKPRLASREGGVRGNVSGVKAGSCERVNPAGPRQPGGEGDLLSDLSQTWQ